MAKVKDTPNLPGSSRLKAPMSSGSNSSLIKETGGMKGGSKGVTKKVMSAASGTGLKKKNPYC
jgi:hypothetical protein